MEPPVKKITIEIDEDIYLKIKAIAELLNPGADLLPAPGHIIKFLVEKYLAEAGSSSPSGIVKPEVIEHLRRKELAFMLKAIRAHDPDLRNYYFIEVQNCRTKIDYLLNQAKSLKPPFPS